MERRRVARLGYPAWAEASVPQPDAMVEDATSPSPKAAAVLTEENASRPPLHPYVMRTPATTYASSVSPNMSAYEDLPGHHLLSARNLIASTPDSSYPYSADGGYVLKHDRVILEWDYTGIRDLGAFCRFSLRQTIASPVPMTPVRGTMIQLENASSS